MSLSRPATSAIAAFLVLSAPAVLAQDAPVTEPTAPTVMVPPVAPTAAPAPAPTPAPVIRVPLDVAPEPVAEAPPPPAARAEPRPAARAPARAAPAAHSAAPVSAPAVTEAAANDVAVSPLTETVVAPIAPVVDPAPTPVPAESAASGDAFPWEIAGGAATLLLVGGAGLAFARRRRARRDPEDWDFGDAPADAEWVPAAPAAPAAARDTDPIPNPEPIPAPRTETEAEPVRRTAPAFASAPSGSMGRHEAMALVGPTADNPFATLNKRLKRARFLDRKERMEYQEALAGSEPAARQPVSAWEIAQRPAPAPAEQEVRRPQPVTRGLSHSFRRPGFARD